ncbi:DUF1829 domain-containing protein [Candidatus Methanoperedens nitratireducens]|uniref:DUF1828 domain-containing protein n=1 Tax=Candidatus Methanoperedens nitratireducens TaxID=1392998 RepID=A0A284VK15_9EURY|nr:DUF1829 domain-containing protein [Candidatus Methanoperedens nitroreducens]SNQ59614.1 conserved hypothetical protein [Candidatus Methanoperedens nitroreducens]
MGFNECQDLVNKYIEWLKQSISYADKEGICEITTPFLDRHNDCLQIYVKKDGDNLILSDDGYILRDLKLSGFEITTEKRKQLVNAVLSGFGTQLRVDEIVTVAKADNFPQKKHNLIQSMLALNDMFITARSMVESIFKEDVEKFLRLHEIRFTPSVKFTGKSGFDQSFDFVIPSSKDQPERVIQVVNRPTRQNISFLIFSWADTKEVRPVKSTLYGFLNDTEQSINAELESALEQYDIKPVLWSKREEYLPELVA